MNEFLSPGIPAFYDYRNYANAVVTPSTVHVMNTGLSRFYQRYLLQKALSVFKWNLPETWSKNYFLYVLYCRGFIAVIDTDEFGVICQQCGLRGFDIMYQPTNAVVTNPLLAGPLEPRIGSECAVIKLAPDYGGILDLVTYYGDLMALASETASTNLLNSKLSYVFTAKNKAGAEALKKLYDRVASGEPAVVQDKSLLNDDGSPAWQAFEQSVGANYIVPQILADLRKIEEMFDTDVGIPNANTDKRERLISDEVNANNTEVASKCELWLESLQEGCEMANSLFGLDLSVDWRVDPKQIGGGANEIDSLTPRDI